MERKKIYILTAVCLAIVLFSVAFSFSFAPSKTKNPIELRFTSTPPPDPEPDYWILMDIVDMPDPIPFAITIHYYNSYSTTLYFEVTGNGTNYNFTTVQLGSLSAGGHAYKNLQDFFTRKNPQSIPAGELNESVDVTLKAYADSDYSELKFVFTRTLHIKLLDSNSSIFNVVLLDDFDDGTITGWSVSGYGTSLLLSSEYPLSGSYSLLARAKYYSVSVGKYTITASKDLDLSNVTSAYAIINFRISESSSYVYIKSVTIYQDDKTLLFLGILYSSSSTRGLPVDQWLRVVVPLSGGSTTTIKITTTSHVLYASGKTYYSRLYLDDFKVISKG